MPTYFHALTANRRRDRCRAQRADCGVEDLVIGHGILCTDHAGLGNTLKSTGLRIDASAAATFVGKGIDERRDEGS
jgi:hypothetical protein